MFLLLLGGFGFFLCVCVTDAVIIVLGVYLGFYFILFYFFGGGGKFYLVFVLHILCLLVNIILTGNIY